MAAVSGEKPDRQDVTCNASTTVPGEAGRVRLFCTEKKRHRGDHYDRVFSMAWPRMKYESKLDEE